MAAHEHHGTNISRASRQHSKLRAASIIALERLEELLGKNPPLAEGMRAPQAIGRRGGKPGKGFRMEGETRG